LPRPPSTGATLTPRYPPDLPYPAIMLRISDKYRIPLREIDEWALDDIFDEDDALRYLHDVDNPPRLPGS